MPLDKEELGRRLKHAREAVGLSQDNVATQLSISRGALAQFEAGAKRASDRERASAVAECVKLCREYTNLEKLLGVDQDRAYDVSYNPPPMRTRWDAIRQGERLAELARARLSLGGGPPTNPAE